MMQRQSMLESNPRPALAIYLLGRPRVEYQGRPLMIPRRQSRALLYRLATQLQPVPRKHLYILFWPDASEAVASRSLSRLLTHLRRELPLPDLLLAQEDAIVLSSRQVWSDVAEFERLCAVHDPHEQFSALRQAVELYNGPFLDGSACPAHSEFDSWAASMQDVLEYRYLSALSALIEEQSARKEFEAAITYARRYLAVDNLAEEMHRRLIMMYASIGDRSAALRQYEICSATLERDLGVSPMPETQALFQLVLEGGPVLELIGVQPPVELVLERGGPRAPQPASPELAIERGGPRAPQPASPELAIERAGPPTAPAWTPPLVGRDDVLEQIEQVYTGVQASSGAVLLLSGEPGIGKSRMLQAIVERWQGRALVLSGAGASGTSMLAYHPIVQMLRAVLCGPQRRRAIHAIWLAEVANILPELRTLYHDLPLPPVAAPDQAQLRLFEALCQIVLVLTEEADAVVLCLDDLHWIDGATLDWLAYLGQRLADRQLLIVGTYDSAEAASCEPLRHSMARLGLLHEVQLASLTTAQARELLGPSIGRLPESATLISQLQIFAGGNPLFLLELAQAIARDGALLLALGDLKDLAIPETIHQVIGQRLRQLSPSTLRILEAGAVLGPVFSFDLVQLASGRSEAETMDALDDLVAQQLLRYQAATYHFQHEATRLVVYHSLSYARRLLLQQRVAQITMQRHAHDAATIMRHCERARQFGSGLHLALSIGLAAKARSATTDACANFALALSVLEQETAQLQQPEVRAIYQHLHLQVLVSRSKTLLMIGDIKTYEADSRTIRELAQQLGDQHLLRHLGWREACIKRWACRYDEARAIAERGLGEVADDRLLAAFYQHEIGLAAREQGDYGAAQAALEQALSGFSQQDASYHVHALEALTDLATLAWYRAEYSQALALAQQALHWCDDLELPLERRRPLGVMGAVAGSIGRFHLARGYLQESLAGAQQITDRRQEIFCAGQLGWLAIQQQRPHEALHHFDAALAIARQIESLAEQCSLYAGLTSVCRQIGEHEEALEHARQAHALAEATGRYQDRALVQQALGEPSCVAS